MEGARSSREEEGELLFNGDAVPVLQDVKILKIDEEEAGCLIM